MSSDSEISISDFQAIHIKIGTIMDAQRIPKSNKLLKLQVDIGENRERQIVAGIAEFYECESLIGTQVCVLTNLKPTKFMGEVSEGMILACKDSNGLNLLRVDSKKENGARIS